MATDRASLADDEVVERALRDHLDELQRQAIEDLRVSLYKQISSLESVQNLNNLERLASLVAQFSQAQHLRYSFLQDDAFDVDRRTLRDTYFDVLERLQLFSASAEYDNKRPRAVRPYLRDVGLVNAFADRDHRTVTEQREARFELLRTVCFDHTVRLSYTLCDDADPKRGVVKYWRADRDGEQTVDCIPKIAGVPVPITIAGPNETAAAHDRVRAFLEQNEAVFREEYDRLDRRTTATERDRIEEYVTSERFNGAPTEPRGSGGESSTLAVGDAAPAFGLVLIEGQPRDGSIVESESVTVDGEERPIYQLPIWLYLAIA